MTPETDASSGLTLGYSTSGPFCGTYLLGPDFWGRAMPEDGADEIYSWAWSCEPPAGSDVPGAFAGGGEVEFAESRAVMKAVANSWNARWAPADLVEVAMGLLYEGEDILPAHYRVDLEAIARQPVKLRTVASFDAIAQILNMEGADRLRLTDVQDRLSPNGFKLVVVPRAGVLVPSSLPLLDCLFPYGRYDGPAPRRRISAIHELLRQTDRCFALARSETSVANVLEPADPWAEFALWRRAST